jgi:hypothetical protein
MKTGPAISDSERIDRLEYDVKSLVDRLFKEHAAVEYKDGLAYINGNPYISLKALASKSKRVLKETLNRYLLEAPKET